MILPAKEVPNPPSPTPPGLAIRPATTVEEMRTWSRVTMAGFGLGRNLFRWILNEKSLQTLNYRTYVGWVSGRPVSTSGCYISDGVAGIVGVSTVPSQRGRGYGEAMTWETIRYGLSKGCDLFYLQANPSGFPVYHRMGFRRIFDIEEWVVSRSRRTYTKARTRGRSQ